MLDTDPINLHFTIPATDHLGKKEVQGQLRFHADHIDLHWRLKGNVFTGGPSEMTLITIPYPSVAEVDLKQKWLRPSVLLLRLEDPSLVAEVPNIEVGRMLLTIDKQSKAQKKLAEHARARRLQMELTQEGLAERSGVPLPTLRKFEQKGAISLESFLKLQMVLGGLEDILKATQIKDAPFSSIDDVLEAGSTPTRQRGKRK